MISNKLKLLPAFSYAKRPGSVRLFVKFRVDSWLQFLSFGRKREQTQKTRKHKNATGIDIHHLDN